MPHHLLVYLLTMGHTGVIVTYLYIELDFRDWLNNQIFAKKNSVIDIQLGHGYYHVGLGPLYVLKTDLVTFVLENLSMDYLSEFQHNRISPLLMVQF